LAPAQIPFCQASQVAPYLAFTYFVELMTNSGSKALAGFWHVSGLPPSKSGDVAMEKLILFCCKHRDHPAQVRPAALT
jgi:hypothetical protein